MLSEAVNMTPTVKSLAATVAVLGATAAILLGAMMRDRVDVGGANAIESAPVAGLMASTDKSEVPEGDYFYEISNLLKQRYVENITDEQKLALGAIRGMVASLGDPDSLYMERPLFQVHQKMRRGEYEGIGAQLELIYTEPRDKGARGSGQPIAAEEALMSAIRIPKLTVVSLVPGGPAEAAGVKIGDYVEYVGDHWVPNAETVASFRKMQSDFADGKVSWDEISKVRLELTQRTKKTLLPLKAREQLLTGTDGAVTVTWKRGDQSITTKIAKAASKMPAFSNVDGAIHLRFIPGVDQELKEAIEGHPEVTIDLRNNANGLSGPMSDCLEVLAPKGVYGAYGVAKRQLPIEVKKGNPNPPKVRLIVDSSTRGAAEVFALALEKAGIGKIEGKSAGHPIITDDFALPDGSGYSLAIAEYREVTK
jgi:carboxyl-terminal processing protease